MLEREYQAGGGHGGMSVLVDFETGHLEIGNLVDESAILCAEGDMFGHWHIESTAINEGTPGLLVIYRSPMWIEEHGSASSEHEWRHGLAGRHPEGRKLHNSGTRHSVNIHRHECGAAAPRERLMIPEIIVIPFDREPVREVKPVTGHHAAGVRWLIGDPIGGGLLLEETGTLNGQLIFDFLS